MLLKLHDVENCQFSYSLLRFCIGYPDEECEKAYRKVIEGQISVDIYIARLNYLGLPRSGKTCTLKRLTGDIVNIESAKWTKELQSTGVAERNQAYIRKVSKHIGFASNSQWSKSDLSGETAIVNDFIQQAVKGMIICSLIEYSSVI